MKRKKPNRRKVVVRRYNHIDARVRLDPQFLPMFTIFAKQIGEMSKKKHFNKKEFSRAFMEFNEIVGIYPFPHDLVTSYMKRDWAFKRVV